MEKKCHLHSTQHQPQFIQSLCLQKQCKEKRFLCFFCIHTQHKNHEMIFLKKELPQSIFQFYENLQRFKQQDQDKHLPKCDYNICAKANEQIKECDQLKQLIQAQLESIKNQYFKLACIGDKKIMSLTPDKFIQDVYQGQNTIVEKYVAEILELKSQKPSYHEDCMFQLISEYQNSLKKILKFSKTIFQTFRNKCIQTNKILQKKRWQKKSFVEKIEKMISVQNREVNKMQTQKKKHNKSQHNEVIDLEMSSPQNQIDFVVAVQKNYLKKIKKTKSILKTQKQQKIQSSPKFYQNKKTIIHQGQNISPKKSYEINQRCKNVDKKKNSKKEELVKQFHIEEFIDDPQGIPKKFSNAGQKKQQTLQKSQIQQMIHNVNMENQYQTIYQDNQFKSQIQQKNRQFMVAQYVNQRLQSFQAILQEEIIQLQKSYIKIKKNTQENNFIQAQINLFSQNNSSEIIKSKLTKMVQEQNQIEMAILKGGDQFSKPILIQNMPYRLFQIRINNEVKFEQEDIKRSMQDQIQGEIDPNHDQKQYELHSQFIQSQRKNIESRRGRPSKKLIEVDKNKKIQNKIEKVMFQNQNSAIFQSRAQQISIKKVVLECYDHQEVDNSLRLLNKRDVKQLYISTDCMESAVDQQTIKIIIQMKNLQRVHIYPCSNLQQKQFLKLVKNLKKLKQLVLHQFNNFSQLCAEYLANYHPQIEKVSFSSDYKNHMANIQDNYQFLNSFIIDSSFKKTIQLSNLQNLQNLSLTNVGNCTSLENQMKKMVNRLKYLKQLYLAQNQAMSPVNYEKFFEFLSKQRHLKFTSIVLQNVMFYETHLILILSRSQCLQTLMIHECPKQFGNQLISCLPKYCKGLQQLSLFQNDTINGQQIFGLKQLKILALRGTWGINKDVFARNILGLKNLQRLLLTCNNFWFDDSLMKIVCCIKGLKSLNIDFTKVTDKGIQHLEKLQDLQILICGNTQVTTEGLIQIFKQKPLIANSLKKLGLNKTKTNVKKANQSHPHDIHIREVNESLLNKLGKLLPNLTHLAVEGMKKLTKQNVCTFSKLKCLKYNQNSLTPEAQKQLNDHYVFLNSNPW